MLTYLKHQKKNLLFSTCTRLLVIALSFSLIFSPAAGYAQVGTTILNLPAPGAMVTPSPAFVPVLLKGMTIHPDNPLQFDFIVDSGNTHLQGQALRKEASKLFKYFLAALTVPEEELWVNLSPYEKERVIPQGFGDTEMGRDLLAQDYLLKQLTASLMYPEKELGREFWDRVYKKAYEQYGTTEVPMNTFNKVWIVPEKAVIYEQGASAFVVDAHLKVMLEEDYLAMNQGTGTRGQGPEEKLDPGPGTLGTEIIKEVILPEIEKEVNEGKTFANLRQIYNASILAAWYKINLKESLLGQVYADQNKTKGVDTQDKEANQKIYNQYLEAFKKGVYNYIKEDHDPATREIIPRKYFSGGVSLALKEKDATNLGVKGKTSILRRTAKGVLSWILAGSLAGMPAMDAEAMVAKGLRPNAAEAKAYQFAVDVVGIGPKADQDYITTVSNGTLVKSLGIESQNSGGTPSLLAQATEERSQEMIGLDNQLIKEVNRNAYGFSEIERLLRLGADVNARDDRGRTVLMRAAMPNRHEIIEPLIDHGALVNTRDTDGNTALMLAAQNGHYEVVEILLDHGAEINAKNNAGQTALMMTFKRAYFLAFVPEYKTIATTKRLLDHGAQVNTRDNAGNTALMLAVSEGNITVVKMLLSYGSDVNAINNEGRTVLNYAIIKDYNEIIDLLVNAGAKDNRTYDTEGSFLNAAYNGDIVKIQELLQFGTDVNIRDKETEATALMIASRKGHNKVVKILLDHGARINIQAKNGVTALMFAARGGYDKVVRILLGYGAGVNFRTKEGTTALMFAAENGHYEVVKILLDNGAEVNLQENNSFTKLTALIVAAANGHYEVVKILLDNGADINIRSRIDWTALIHASQYGHNEIVKILLEHGAQIKVRGNDVDEALLVAASDAVDHDTTVRILLEHGAQVNTKDEDGETTLMIAVRKGHDKIVGTLLDHDAKVNIQAKNGMTALMLASRYGHDKIVKMLLKNGANVNVKDDNGRTSLYYAQQFGHEKIIKLLKKAGAKDDRSSIEPLDEDSDLAMETIDQEFGSSPIKITENLATKAIAAAIAAMTLCTGPGCGPGPDKKPQPTETIEQPPSVEQPPSIEDILNWSDAQLMGALDNSSWDIQKAAAQELYRRDHEEGIALAREKLVDPRIKKLTSSDPKTFNAGVYQELIELGEIILESLKKNVQDITANANTRRGSIYLLEDMGQYNDIFGGLEYILKNKLDSLFAFAVKRLEILILAQVSPLNKGLELLTYPVAGVRQAAANALGSFGNADAIIPLVNARSVESDQDVVKAIDLAINNIYTVGDITTWNSEQLMRALDSSSWTIQKAAAQELFNRNHTLGIQLARQKLVNPRIDNMSMSELIQLGEISVDPLIATFLNPNVESWKISGIMNTLRLIGSERAVNALYEALTHSDYWIRTKAIDQIVLLGDDRAANALTEYVRQAAANDQYALDAIRGLGKLRGIIVVNALIEFLLDRDLFNATERYESARALGNVGDPSAIDALIAAMFEDPDVRTRGAAAYALGEIGDERAIPSLISVVKNEGEDTYTVRSRAVIALLQFNDVQIIDPFIIYLQSDESKTAAAVPAAEALLKFWPESERAVPVLLDELKWGNIGATWLVHKTEYTAEALSAILFQLRNYGWADYPKYMGNDLDALYGFKRHFFQETNSETFAQLLLGALPEDRDILKIIYLTNQPDHGFTTDAYLYNLIQGKTIENEVAEIFNNSEVLNSLVALETMSPDVLKRDIPIITRVEASGDSWIAQDMRTVALAQKSVVTKLLAQEGDLMIPLETTAHFWWSGEPDIIIDLPAVIWSENDIPQLQELLQSPYPYFQVAAQKALDKIAQGDLTVVSPSSSPLGEIKTEESEVGGIDLNPALLDLQTKTDGKGVPLPLPQQPIGEMHIEGFIPVIINVIPIPNLPLLLGLDDTKGGKKGLSHTSGFGPMESKKRFELKDFNQVGLLN